MRFLIALAMLAACEPTTSWCPLGYEPKSHTTFVTTPTLIMVGKSPVFVPVVHAIPHWRCEASS